MNDRSFREASLAFERAKHLYEVGNEEVYSAIALAKSAMHHAYHGIDQQQKTTLRQMHKQLNEMHE